MPRIVLIDDSPTACTILRRILEREGWSVETYLRPLSALQALWQQVDTPPAALILDVQLPQLDGFSVTSLIRTSAPTVLRSVPIIGLSARDGVMDRVKGRMLGMHAYLSKPFDPADLLAALRVVQALLLAS